jgi:hypothetical protein
MYEWTRPKEEANHSSDADVKKFADDTAKIIQEHLDLAKQSQSKLNSESRRFCAREAAHSKERAA